MKTLTLIILFTLSNQLYTGIYNGEQFDENNNQLNTCLADYIQDPNEKLTEIQLTKLLLELTTENTCGIEIAKEIITHPDLFKVALSFREGLGMIVFYLQQVSDENIATTLLNVARSTLSIDQAGELLISLGEKWSDEDFESVFRFYINGYPGYCDVVITILMKSKKSHIVDKVANSISNHLCGNDYFR